MTATATLNLGLALVHAPVINRRGETIGSAVTNLDLHDIARAGKTYGVDTFWVVTPYQEQQELVGQIVGHWTDGHGSKAASDRAHALSIVRICADLEEVIEQAEHQYGRRPLVLATAATPRANPLQYRQVRQRLWAGEPLLLLFGTAWGLAPQALELADASLPPIQGNSEFNHLSVRSAVSIILDRLLALEVEQ
ncbi:RNA methyltransferase [Desulfogranum mediterraneum]|uniref:RNA methyltransferase n=1 Tax=Desulfogranum mediterraneum TaxID=160661 RepID=UPI000415CAED|nr:RNA methyltransferase [Desulfogranum mediterraneum]